MSDMDTEVYGGRPQPITKHLVKRPDRLRDIPRKVVIAVGEERMAPKKVAHIMISGDGSVAISSPYHPGRSGVLSKAMTPRIPSADGSGFAEWVEQFTVTVPVKMSLHSTGFVQFSQTGKIWSGATEDFAIPKGLGIHCPPFWTPIETGPTFGLQMYDAPACKGLDSPRQQDTRYLVYEEGDYAERDAHDSTLQHMYMVEGFIFDRGVTLEAGYEAGKGLVLHRAYSTRSSDWFVTFRLVELPVMDFILGILVSREHVPPGTTGYRMSSPRSLTREHFILADYTNEANPGPGAESLMLPGVATPPA